MTLPASTLAIERGASRNRARAAHERVPPRARAFARTHCCLDVESLFLRTSCYVSLSTFLHTICVSGLLVSAVGALGVRRSTWSTCTWSTVALGACPLAKTQKGERCCFERFVQR
eukprot:4970987-Prymnesium_polylepis.1